MPDTLAIRTQAANIAAAVGVREGHPPLECDADTVAILLASLSDGNYRETACADAGISKHSLYRALKRAEAGDEAAILFRDAVERAEGQAEAGIVRSWRKAIDAGPQYWAAAATFLERKSPDRWGRRQDDAGTPKVVVQIGARDSDITVSVGSITSTPSTTIDATQVVPTSYLESPQVTEGSLSDTDTDRIKVQTTREGMAETPRAQTTPTRRGNRRGTRPGTDRGPEAPKRQRGQRR